MLRLDGTLVAKTRRERLAAAIKDFREKSGIQPGLAVVLVGDDPASQVYVKNKIKTCEEVGIKSFASFPPATTTEADLLAKVKELNEDKNVHGILVQLPLPKHISEEKILDALDPKKDPDGLTAANLGLFWSGRTRVAPCTPTGVMKILEHFKIALAGKRAVVIGRSNIVGKPMAHHLINANATVTVVHSKTPDVSAITREADIVVVAAGKPRFMGKNDFKKGAVVVDVGIHRENGKLCGDVRYEELEGWAEAATPVPGGVGPMTIQMLMENTLHLAELAQKNH
jgi:methylenetetrahydrofolate dehydrogenase (NADP+)/methenyltetrahydrofolate cyclohydrolase